MEKKILVIGSAVVEVIIDLEDNLPTRGQDVHVRAQKMQMGGCGFNTYHMIRHFGVPVIPFFPIGTGAYSGFVRDCFREAGIRTPIPTALADNGCCYCFVEPDGERTFISYHGAEYRFLPEWFSLIHSEEIHSIFICGLEIEETTGKYIVDFLEKNPAIPLFFSPGPRLVRIDPLLTDRLFALHPILHLNKEEACAFAGADSIWRSARILFEKTGNTVIITLSKDGCYYFDGREEAIIPAVPAVQIDTIGAGDSHIGAIMASLYNGCTLKDAIRIANRISARVVSVPGALLSDREFEEVRNCFT